MRNEQRTDLLSWDDVEAALATPAIKAEFRVADREAPVEMATRAIRMAAAWLESELEAEAEELWEGKREFHELAAAPLCLPNIFGREYRALEIQKLSDLAVDVGEKLIESEELFVTAEELVALAIFDLAHAEVGDFEIEGMIRDKLLAKHVHGRLHMIQIETLGCSDVVPLFTGSSESLKRDLALEIEPREIIAEWFEDF